MGESSSLQGFKTDYEAETKRVIANQTSVDVLRKEELSSPNVATQSNCAEIVIESVSVANVAQFRNTWCARNEYGPYYILKKAPQHCGTILLGLF